MKLSLVVMTPGKQEGKTLPISLAQFIIGRDPGCQLRPASPMISKRHCAIIQRDNKAFIRDFASTNGTLLNEQPVDGETELHDGDQLKVGPLHFVVKLEATLSPSRPTPAPPTQPAPVALAKSGTGKVAPKPESATPAPAKLPAAAAGGDDDIAAMLLSIEGDETGTLSSSGDVPEGSTVMDVVVPPLDGMGAAAKAAKDKENEKKAANLGNTSSAAKSILDKYMRRPRS